MKQGIEMKKTIDEMNYKKLCTGSHAIIFILPSFRLCLAQHGDHFSSHEEILQKCQGTLVSLPGFDYQIL